MSLSAFVYAVRVIYELDRVLLSDYVISEAAFNSLTKIKWALGLVVCSAVMASVLGIMETLIKTKAKPPS